MTARKKTEHPYARLVKGRRICILDTETTGLDPQKDHIIELGWTWLEENGEVTSGGSKLFKSPVPIPNSDVHGITDAMVAECGPFDPAVVPHATIYAAYNCLFDRAMLVAGGWGADDAWFVDVGELTLPTLALVQRQSMDKLAKRLHIEIPADAHRAERDSRVAALILQRVLYGA